MINLYDYQIEAVNATAKSSKGILVLPTGTGKTMIQSAILEKDIVANSGRFSLYVVNAPRIILTYQLLKEVYSFLVSRGIEARYHFTHSGSPIDESDLEQVRRDANDSGESIPFSQIGSTTSSEILLEVMESAKALNIPMIIFSTYNSADRVEAARARLGKSISIVINDEAHYLVQDRFYDIIDSLKSERCYFFTATTRKTGSDTGRGMNNVSSYGEVLYRLLPRDAIDRGKMIRPRIHTIRTDGVRTDEDFDRSLNLVIYNSFLQHSKHFAEVHPGIVPKILVSTRGSHDMKGFLESIECQSLQLSGVDVFAISSSEEIGNWINGSRVKRQEFLNILRAYGKETWRPMLVLHYDILTDGIDVPGFTSCMPLRTLNKSRFIQTFGRCARLDVRDRSRLEAGEISPSEIEKMYKPYAYVILPDITLTNRDDYENMKGIIVELRDYNFNPAEDVIGEDDPFGIDVDDSLDGFNLVNRKNKMLGQIIAEVKSEFELEAIARLSPMEYLEQNAIETEFEHS